MHTKMNASPWHLTGCGVDIKYASMTPNNAYRWWSAYLTLKSGSSRGNITYNKWEMIWTCPFGVIAHTSIAMHVIIVIILTLEMTCTWGSSKGQSKVILDICGFVVHQGWPSHILSMPSFERPYTIGTPSGTRSKTNKISPSKKDGKYLTPEQLYSQNQLQ